MKLPIRIPVGIFKIPIPRLQPVSAHPKYLFTERYDCDNKPNWGTTGLEDFEGCMVIEGLEEGGKHVS